MANSPAETTRQAFWQDRTAQISLGLAIVLNLLLFILVLIANQPLNEAMATTRGVSGAADPSAAADGAPFNVLILPIIGLVSWLVGGALGVFYYNVRDEAPVAYIIFGSVVLIGVATWVPALTLIINL